jgi:hypothetical protein
VLKDLVSCILKLFNDNPYSLSFVLLDLNVFPSLGNIDLADEGRRMKSLHALNMVQPLLLDQLFDFLEAGSEVLDEFV